MWHNVKLNDDEEVVWLRDWTESINYSSQEFLCLQF